MRTAPPPNIVYDVVAFLAAADRTPADYQPAQLAAILHHGVDQVGAAIWVLKHWHLGRPDSWPEEWLEPYECGDVYA